MTHPLMVANKFALPFSFFTLLVKYNYLHSRIRHDGSRFYFNDLKFYLKKKKRKNRIYLYSSLLLHNPIRNKFQNRVKMDSKRLPGKDLSLFIIFSLIFILTRFKFFHAFPCTRIPRQSSAQYHLNSLPRGWRVRVRSCL